MYLIPHLMALQSLQRQSFSDGLAGLPDGALSGWSSARSNQKAHIRVDVGYVFAGGAYAWDSQGPPNTSSV